MEDKKIREEEAQEEAQEEKQVVVKRPVAMPFIMCNVLFERFCSSGISCKIFFLKLNNFLNVRTFHSDPGSLLQHQIKS